MHQVIIEIRETLGLNKAQFADVLDVSPSLVTLWEQGKREPGKSQIAQLLRVAPPELQAQLLQALGIDDVTQFAADLLASAGVLLVQVEGKVPNGS